MLIMNDQELKQYVEAVPKEQRADRAIAAALLWPESSWKAPTWEELEQPIAETRSADNMTDTKPETSLPIDSAAALAKISECGNWLLGVREHVIANKIILALGRTFCLQSELDELKVILRGKSPND